MLLFKCDYMKARTWKKRWYWLVSHFHTNTSLQKKIYNISTKYNGKDCRFMVNYASSYAPIKQTVSKECYGKGIDLMFEGISVRVPDDARNILNCIYQCYWILPPKDQRTGKHQMVDTLDEKHLKERQMELDIQKQALQKNISNI